MTQRGKKFIEEYMVCLNAAEAARRAGYSEEFAARQGYKLLNNPEIRAEIDSRLEKISGEKVLQQQQLLEFLSAVVRGEVTDTQLMTRLTGKGTSKIEKHEYRACIKDRIRAAELLLKIAGAFKDKEDGRQDSAKLFVDTLTRVWAENGE